MKYVTRLNDNTYNDYIEMITRRTRVMGYFMLFVNIVYQVKQTILPIEGSN